MTATPDQKAAIREFSASIYSACWSVLTFIGAVWLYGMMGVLAAIVIEYFLVWGQHAFGSGTWPTNGIVRAYIEGHNFSNTMAPFILAAATLAAAIMSERNTLMLSAFTLGTTAFHLMIIGSLF